MTAPDADAPQERRRRKVEREPTARRGCWASIKVELADRTTIELRIGGVVAAAIASSADPLGEAAVIVTDAQGQQRVERLGL